MDKDFPKLPDPLKDLPKDLQKRWKRLKKHYPEGVFVVAVDQPQGRLWRGPHRWRDGPRWNRADVAVEGGPQ